LSYALALFLCSGGGEPLANDDVWQTIRDPAHLRLMFPQESHQPVYRVIPGCTLAANAMQQSK
jgi:hypothetical protein